MSTCLIIPSIQALRHWAALKADTRDDAVGSERDYGSMEAGCAAPEKAHIDQLISITLATSPWHSAHWPTRSRSPPLTVPEKLVIVTSCLHLPHQTLERYSFFTSLGIFAQSFAAGAVKFGMDSMAMIFYAGDLRYYPSNGEVRRLTA